MEFARRGGREWMDENHNLSSKKNKNLFYAIVSIENLSRENLQSFEASTGQKS